MMKPLYPGGLTDKLQNPSFIHEFRELHEGKARPGSRKSRNFQKARKKFLTKKIFRVFRKFRDFRDPGHAPSSPNP